MSAKTKDNMTMKYIGGGFVIGVPARDLSAAEFADLSDDQKAQVLASGFYKTTVQPDGKKEE